MPTATASSACVLANDDQADHLERISMRCAPCLHLVIWRARLCLVPAAPVPGGPAPAGHAHGAERRRRSVDRGRHIRHRARRGADRVTLETAPGTRITVLRSTIARRITDDRRQFGGRAEPARRGPRLGGRAAGGTTRASRRSTHDERDHGDDGARSRRRADDPVRRARHGEGHVKRASGRELALVVVLAVGALAATAGAGWSPKLGLDLAGGSEIIYKPAHTISNGHMSTTIDIIRNRVGGAGVSGANVNSQGGNIVVQLPGIKNPQEGHRSDRPDGPAAVPACAVFRACLTAAPKARRRRRRCPPTALAVPVPAQASNLTREHRHPAPQNNIGPDPALTAYPRHHRRLQRQPRQRHRAGARLATVRAHRRALPVRADPAARHRRGQRPGRVQHAELGRELQPDRHRRLAWDALAQK